MTTLRDIPTPNDRLDQQICNAIAGDTSPAAAAIRAVLDYHGYSTIGNEPGDDTLHCECNDTENVPWPCGELLTIADVLGAHGQTTYEA